MKAKHGYWLRHDENGTEIFLGANKISAGKKYNSLNIKKDSYVMLSHGEDIVTKNNAWASYETSPADLD